MTSFLSTDVARPEPWPGPAVGFFLLLGDTQSWKPSNGSEHLSMHLTQPLQLKLNLAKVCSCIPLPWVLIRQVNVVGTCGEVLPLLIV